MKRLIARETVAEARNRLAEISKKQQEEAEENLRTKQNEERIKKITIDNAKLNKSRGGMAGDGNGKPRNEEESASKKESSKCCCS